MAVVASNPCGRFHEKFKITDAFNFTNIIECAILSTVKIPLSAEQRVRQGTTYRFVPKMGSPYVYIAMRLKCMAFSFLREIIGWQFTKQQ